MKITWREVAGLTHRGMGHGVLFYGGAPRPGPAPQSKFSDNSVGPDECIVAVVHGFDWLHGRPEETMVEIRPPDATFDAAFLASAREDISALLHDPSLLRRADPRLTPRIYVHVHG